MKSHHASATGPRGKSRPQNVKLIEIALPITLLVSIALIAYIGLVCCS